MPTTPIATYGYGRVDPLKDPESAHVENVNLKASTTYAAGTILGEITATPGTYGPYVFANTDGTQLPSCILQYACVTDASGNVTFGSGPAGTSEWGHVAKSAPAYFSGEFATQDLVGLDANVVTGATASRVGRLLQGSITNGRMVLYGA
jgi:hypothetical protein